MIALADLDRSRLERLVLELGGRSFHARQLYRWLYMRRVADPEQMSDLPRALRQQLCQRCHTGFPEVEERIGSADGTLRYVYRLADGRRSESVMIPGVAGRSERVSLCLSTQVGCALACAFCLSGANGLKRNLGHAEIIGQAWRMLLEAPPHERVNVVFMGIGEPLDNLEGLRAALATLGDPDGFGIAPRRITVSTAGKLPGIEELARLPRRPMLAISLNATTDEQRNQIMPINRAWNLEQLFACLRRFPLRRRERLTFEFVMLAGFNDSDDDARRLARMVRGLPCKINLIPWNPSPGLPFGRPTRERVDRFAELLHEQALKVTVRRRRGDEVSAACGQLSFMPRRDSPQLTESAP